MTIPNFTHNPRARGRIELSHRDYGRRIRVLLIASKTQPSDWPYVLQHARHIHNLTPSLNDPSKTKHEAFYRVKPRQKDLHRFGTPVVVKILPTPTTFQPRAIRIRWYCYAE